MFQSRLFFPRLLRHLALPPRDLPINFPSPLEQQLLFLQVPLPPPHMTRERDNLGKGEERGKVRITKEGRKRWQKQTHWLSSFVYLHLPLSARPTSDSLPLGAEPRVDVSRLDLRVGRILSVRRHPHVATLSVQEVDVGEHAPRTVVSKLGEKRSLEEVISKYCSL